MYPWQILLFFSIATKSVLLVAVAGAVMLALRNASAGLRCLVRQTAMAALLSLPILSMALPVWRVPVLPGSGPSRAHASGTGRRRETAQQSSGPDGASAARLPLQRAAVRGSAPRRSGAAVPWAEPAWVLGLWLAGLIAVVAPAGYGYWASRRLLRQARPVEAGPLSLALRAAQEELGWTAPVHLLVGPEQGLPAVPMTCDLSPAKIILPHAASGWPADRLRSVLLHELAHVARRDWLWRWLGVLACSLYWWNPGVWLLERRLREDAEAACDDCVLSAGVTPSTYATHLLEIVRGLGSSRAGHGNLAMAHRGHLSARLNAVLAPERSRATLGRAHRVLARTFLAAAIVPLSALFPGPRGSSATPPLVRRTARNAPGAAESTGAAAPRAARPHRPAKALGTMRATGSRWNTGEGVGKPSIPASPTGTPAVSPVLDAASGAPPQQADGPGSLQPQAGLGPMAWGDAVHGVQTSLRVEKASWKTTEPIVLTLDVRNEGSQLYAHARLPLFAEVEVDGTWYRYGGSRAVRAPVWPLEPGKHVDDWVQVSLEGPWVEKSPGRDGDALDPVRPKRLQLGSGRHVLRVAFPFYSGTLAAGEAIRPVSYPVEIRVEGDPPGDRSSEPR